jgi:threonine/homoserine/homoserine lactone efflux protein
MILLLGIFGSSFIIAFSGALMPGPLLTATIGESSRHGIKAGPIMMVGHSVLELLLVILLLLGLAPFIKMSVVTAVINLIGGLILLWFGVDMIRSIPGLSLEKTGKERNSNHLVLSGIVLSLSNPYWSFWWATIGLGLLLNARQTGPQGIFAFFVGHILADFVWYSVVSATIGSGKKFINRKVYQIIIGICAAFLVFFAVWFFYNGIIRISGK